MGRQVSFDNELEAVLDREPSEDAWTQLCALLASQEGSSLERALTLCRARLARWPARLRRAELPAKPAEPCPAPACWLAGLFRGERDPRLEVVGWGVAHRGILLAFAQHLEPGFSPPNTLRYDKQDGVHAYGCGGGWASKAWGDEDRGISYEDTWTEHPSDDESDDVWSAYGLRDGKSLVLRQWDRTGGFYTFETEAPTPAVLELVLAWGALLREAPPWTLEKAETALAAQASCRIRF